MTSEVENVPELRFFEYQKCWETITLCEATTKIGSGKTPLGGSSVYLKSGIPFLRSQNIQNGILDLNELVYIDASTDENMKNSRTYYGDILLNITGASIGRSTVNTIKRKYANLNQHVCIIRLKEFYDSNFIGQYLISQKGQKKIFMAQSGGSREGLNFKEISKLKFSLPNDIEEQQKIGDFFSKLDRQIELEEQKLAKLEEQKKGYMQQIFSQQLRFKDENGDYYSEWKEKLIKDILEFENNRRKPITSSLREIGKYPYYGATGIIDYVKDYIFDGETRLLIGEDGAKWGAFEESSFIAKNRYWVNNHAHVCKSKINNLDFLNYLLNYKELRTYVTGNAPAKLTYNNLSMIPMFLPSVYEQEKIGNFLKKIDELIGKQNKKINELKIRKQGFLQKMFI